MFRKPLIRSGIVGIEFNGLPTLSLSSSKIPIVQHLDVAEDGMGMGQGRVQLQRFAGRGTSLRISFVGITAAVIGQYDIGIGQTAIRQSVAGVSGYGLIEIGDCAGNVRKSSSVPRVTTLQIQLVGFRILRTLLGDLLLLRAAQSGMQLVRDVART